MSSRARAASALLAALSLLALPAVSSAEAPAVGLPDLPVLASDPVLALPFAARTVVPGVDIDAVTPRSHDLVLVQWNPALRGTAADSALVQSIAATGADLVQPLAPISYLVWANARETRTIRALPGVRFAGVLPADLRVSGSVAGDTDMLQVTVLGTGGDLATLARSRVARTFAGLEGTVLTLPGGLSTARALSLRPDVYSIAAADLAWELRDEKTAQVITQDTATPTVGYEPRKRFGTDGDFVTVAVIDGGVDTTHPELAGRDFTCTDYVALGGLCAAGSSDDAIGHGTFVTGVIAGDGSSGLGDDFLMGLGVAPGVDIHVQNAINLGARRPSITELFADSSRAGASIAQNSWGPASTPRGYDENTRQADRAVRDADPSTPGNQPMTVVFSIMNGSGGTSTQGSPDEAKNIIAVGGTGSSRAGTSGDDLCTCTAHGPNLDGSRLVDIVAPGESVASTRAAYATLCGIPHPDFPSPLHAECTGTSFASPHVSAAAALFISRWTALLPSTPSPALVKAAIVNSGTDLSRFGGVDADGVPLTPVPNEQQGWGRLNLGKMMDALNSRNIYAEEVTFGETGQSTTSQVRVVDPETSLRVTLAYTDADGHGMGGALKSLVNDLDLVVTSPSGVVYRGNVFSGGWSTTGGAADRANNLEQVWVESPEAGVWTVQVQAAAIIGDGIPGVGDATDQDYVLYVTNGRGLGNT